MSDSDVKPDEETDRTDAIENDNTKLHARENDLRVIPQTPEVSQQFLERHPDYGDLVKTSSSTTYRKRQHHSRGSSVS